jgi:H+-transporting ATPase
VISTTLGAVSCFSSLVIRYFMLDSWNPDGLFGRLGLGGVQYEQIIAAIYLKISVSDFLTLFCARTGPKFFWQSKPAPSLLYGACISLAISSLVSIFLPETFIDDIVVSGLKDDMRLFYFVWVVSLKTFLMQDLLKVIVYKWLHVTNFNKLSSTGLVVLPESAKMLVEDMELALQKECSTLNHRKNSTKSKIAPTKIA